MFEEDARDVVWLRLAAAVVAGTCIVWLWWVAPGLPTAVVTLIAGAATAWWIRGYRAHRRTAHLPRAAVRIMTDRIVQQSGQRTDVVLWDAIDRIEFDEDRLAVLLHHSGGTLAIEGPFRGVGIAGVGTTIEAAWRRAQAAGPSIRVG